MDNRDELMEKAKNLGLNGMGNAKTETLEAKIKQAEKTTETPEEKPEEPKKENIQPIIGRILKKNLLHNGAVYQAGKLCPGGCDMESLAKRNII